MITPGEANLIAFRDRTLRVQIQLANESGPLDCTDFTNARAQIRDYPGAPGEPRASINDSSPNGNGGVITWIDKSTGTVELLFTIGDWASFPKNRGGPTDYHWDFAMQEPGGDTNSYLLGIVPFHEVVTQ